MAAEFPPEFTAIPLEDIDPYYQNKKVQKKKSIFSTAGALEVIREAITREKCSFFNIVQKAFDPPHLFSEGVLTPSFF